MSSKLVEFFNRQPRLGALATSDRSGKVNVAYFNSLRMVDENTVVMGLGRNRTLANLQENPHAAFMILEPGKTLDSWKGLRIYMEMKSCETQGPLLQEIKDGISKLAGQKAASMIYAAVTFQVTEIRPLADFGQGWERSI
ncbi:MAG: pyridoxamine 5'-phosphate oxidase family protein [Thermodesulfobacteriota bacterium]